MASKMLTDALSIMNSYLVQNYSSGERKVIRNEIDEMTGGVSGSFDTARQTYSYEEVQAVLSCLNEKESIRKNKGVYYTPSDIVKFILTNSVKLACGKLKPDNLHDMDWKYIPYRAVCYEKSVCDPTCGTGVFLLAALEMKLNLLEMHHVAVTGGRIKKVVSTIHGNDLNRDSIAITKIRLFLCVLHRYGAAKIKGLAKIMNACFASYDFVASGPNPEIQYDIMLGNPPYVEDSKSESVPEKKYGNIYANVLEHAALHLKPGGVLGFVIPLSYVSTPRMRNIRDALYQHIPEQYILSYSDRPDCLFTSVHQKLCVLFGRNRTVRRTIFTGNYRYWYCEERPDLFHTVEVIKNRYIADDYIPKLGTELDVSIYRKLASRRIPLIRLLEQDETPVYLNMRAAFWMKAFLREHTGSEYKVFRCKNEHVAAYCMCLLNSSLFWWYWICVSDCWHITRKELAGFMVPAIRDYSEAEMLAAALEERLEETKRYVGTKQTDYTYKHKDCLTEIHQIDDYINGLYGLTDEESLYIKNFAFRYRVSGGIDDGRN